MGMPPQGPPGMPPMGYGVRIVLELQIVFIA